MSEVITKEAVEAAMKGTKSIIEVMSGVGNDLINEAINLFIMDSILAILKYASVFIVFAIVKRYYDTMIETSSSDDLPKFKGLKTASLVASLIFFISSSFPHIRTIGKALVAPKVFLIEKANELRGK